MCTLGLGLRVRGGRLSARCGLSRSRGDCGRGWGFDWDDLNLHLGAGLRVRGGRLSARCGLSRGGEDCGRRVMIRWGWLVCALKGWGCE